MTLLDFTPEEIRLMLDVSHEYKRLKRAGISHKIHEGKQVALLFEKLQLELELLLLWRLEILGIHPEFLGKDDIQMGKKESIKDTAIVLGRSFDGIEFADLSIQQLKNLRNTLELQFGMG